GTYLALFWTRYAGLDISQVQNIQGVTLILSAVTAIIIGGLSDNFFKFKLGQRFGRRRFFLLFGAPVLLLTTAMWIPNLSYWWYFAIFFLWTMLNQIIMIPYSTIPSEMTTNFNGRTILSSTRMFISGLSGTIIPIVGAALLKTMGDKGATYQTIGTLFIVLFSIALVISYKTTWNGKIAEADLLELEEAKKNKQKFSLTRWFKEIGSVIWGYLTTLRIRAFQRHMAIYLLGVTMMDIFGAVFVFYVIYVLGKDAAFASAMLALGIIWNPTAPLTAWMFAKLGVNKMYSFAFAGMITLLLGFYWLSTQVATMSSGLFTTWALVIGTIWLFFKSFAYSLPWNVFPFVPDVDEIVTRHRREGAFSAMVLFLRRVTQGFSAIIVGMYLKHVGFDATLKTQSAAAHQGLINVLVWWVIAGLVVAWIISLGFRLNSHTHAVLLNEMERLREGGSKAEVTPEAKKVVEDLTGVKYEKVWPDLPEVDAIKG
ncbi:MAG: MFS transporter, partial [Lactobacillaceae bacterium]|nr:MFS transporter [Lactobacillaceae bacterium]